MQRFFKNPMMIIFLGFMIYNSITSGRFDNIGDWAITTILLIPGIVIGITFHEAAHAFAAYKLGDMTPKLQHRVTLNPMSHIDPIGIIALVFVGFGWGKPVQVNPYAFKKYPRLCNIAVDLAGVVTNFVIAFVFTGVLRLLLDVGAPMPMLELVQYAILMNLVLMIFNLLPVPPLDGFGIITEIFNLRKFSWYPVFYNNGTIILLLLIVFNITDGLLTPAINTLLTFLMSVWF